MDALKNPEATFTDVRLAVDSKERDEFQKKLKGLYGQNEKDAIGPPASFYALLLMDGDRVGNLLAERGGTYVSESLAKFTDRVQGIVEEHWGSTVYAGGDDVLAMIPVPNVLECAWELREAYQTAFAGNPYATTSAGIVLAHIRRPLLEVLDEAHRLLDDVAKDKNGRDSLAISLLRSGDRALEWTSTWDDETKQSRLGEIDALTKMWREKKKRKQDGEDTGLIAGEMSTGLVYRLRETMGLLCGFPRWEPGICKTSATIDAETFFAADIRRMLRAAGLESEDEKSNQDEAKKMAAQLLRLVHPIHRKEEIGKPPEIVRDTSRMGLDGLLLALLLATEWAAARVGEGKSDKPGRKAHEQLGNDLARWLEAQKVYAAIDEKKPAESLIEALMKGDQKKYLHAQAEALAWLLWLKKFCQAMLPKGKTSED